MGAAILEQGGNAVDAAVTTALCQGLYNPMASGVGGGGFMVIRHPDGGAEFVNARETAPAAATENMYARNASLSLAGGLAIAVPLELHGLYQAHELHGDMPWGDLVRPVIPLARQGFPAHPYLVDALHKMDEATLEASPLLRETFFIQDGSHWRAPRINETCCVRTAFADTLEQSASY
ncbi:gamma-glutamyltranspeptidase [Helicosporidium sp. ATCC 50920]|nr:gamma-glutamyltranspeptidase [Helicosporidium sp. ATCC 50920]|eukprot:KDD74337.1 gamma-glutamyltranspeptidase [Helicosporidium sp. ATCC 50920]